MRLSAVKVLVELAGNGNHLVSGNKSSVQLNLFNFLAFLAKQNLISSKEVHAFSITVIVDF